MIPLREWSIFNYFPVELFGCIQEVHVESLKNISLLFDITSGQILLKNNDSSMNVIYECAKKNYIHLTKRDNV